VAGSGLGLYVAARLMRAQCGDLRISERPGGGTTVVLRPSAAGGITLAPPDETAR
jgi:K+-sensing histidine kinase KdpD